MRLSTALLAAWFVAFPTIAISQEQDEFYVLGAGNSSCQVWTAARLHQNAVAQMVGSWLQGYLTGSAHRQAMNQTRLRVTAMDEKIATARREYCAQLPEDKELCTAIALALKPREIMAAIAGSEPDTWLDERCAANPSERIFDSARTLAAELEMYTIGDPVREQSGPRAEPTQAARANAPTDARVFVVAYVEVMPSSESGAIALLKAYRDASRKDEGNSQAEALRQSGRVGHFAVVETWRDERAFTAHRAYAHTKRFLEKLQPLRVSAYDERSHTGLAIGSPVGAPTGAPIQVVTHVDIIPPGETQAAAMLKELAETSRKEDGNVRFDVLQGVRANHFTVLEAWRSEQALEAHATAAHTRKFREEVYPMALNGSPFDERLYEALSR